MDEQQDAPQETVITPLDAVVLDGPKTAGELLVTALRSDMQVRSPSQTVCGTFSATRTPD